VRGRSEAIWAGNLTALERGPLVLRERLAWPRAATGRPVPHPINRQHQVELAPRRTRGRAFGGPDESDPHGAWGTSERKRARAEAKRIGDVAEGASSVERCPLRLDGAQHHHHHGGRLGAFGLARMRATRACRGWYVWTVTLACAGNIRASLICPFRFHLPLIGSYPTLLGLSVFIKGVFLKGVRGSFLGALPLGGGGIEHPGERSNREPSGKGPLGRGKVERQTSGWMRGRTDVSWRRQHVS
jgi:hypothetical protein